jgi:hypothetical protein
MVGYGLRAGTDMIGTADDRGGHMKIVTSALALFVVLTVPISAQTSSTAKPALQWKQFVWYERINYAPDQEPVGPTPEVAANSLTRHASNPGEFVVGAVFKNVGAKAIKLITLHVVFRDTITEQEFLTYYFRFDKKLAPGQTKELYHKIRKGREPDNFRPAGPDKDLRGRTGHCGNTPYFNDLKTGRLVRRRDDAQMLREYPCYYLATVTRIEYADGSVWQP